LKRFKKLNQGKSWKEQIKSFNFCLVGSHAKKEKNKKVKPLAPYTKDYQSIVDKPFNDYETGETKQGAEYFKSLSTTILQYIEHMEHKFEGDTGILERKHIQVDGLVYIGKEANNIEDQPLNVTKPQTFVNMEEIMNIILALTPKEARKLGINHRSTLKRMKDRIMREGKINLDTREVKKILTNIM
jgi:hypothetical protein